MSKDFVIVNTVYGTTKVIEKPFQNRDEMDRKSLTTWQCVNKRRLMKKILQTIISLPPLPCDPKHHAIQVFGVVVSRNHQRNKSKFEIYLKLKHESL